MAMLTGRNSGAVGAINVTPLIDVLLVLLIIFMVITPNQPVGLGAAIPQPPSDQHRPAGPDPTIIVHIDKDLAVTINSEAIDMERLGSRLTEIFKSRAERVVFVKAEKSLEFRHIAKTIDIVKERGSTPSDCSENLRNARC